MKKLRIAFMGTPDFAVPALAALHKSVHDIVCVYSQPPRPKGRGHKVQNSPVHAYAAENNIPVFHPKSLKGKEEQDIFESHNLDVAIVAAYGLILPKAVLDAPKHGCINIHASLLPRWRGASPIQHSIWKGDEHTGVTLMQMDQGLDTGPQIAEEAIHITEETTAQSLHDDLSKIGGEMILKTVDRLAEEGVLTNTPQDNAQSTYAPLLKKEDGKIDWTQTASQIDQQIRALNPWPGTYTEMGSERLKIQSAVPIGAISVDEKPGTIINKKGYIACGDKSVLQIKTLQPAGKKPMDFSSALNGGYIKIGEQFQ